MFKLATWNVNSIKVRLPHVLQWLQTSQVDVLGLQELKVTDENFPVDEFKQEGYDVSFAGQKTYNGVALISKQPLEAVVTDMPQWEDPQRRLIAASVGPLRVINVYVPNGQSVGSDKFNYKLTWLQHFTDFVREQLQQYPDLAIMGDFNIAPEDRDVHDPATWVGHVLVSPQERQALQDIKSLGLEDSFRLFDQADGLFSWWDYRAGGFRRNHGLRIDLILLSQALAKNCRQCYIDKEPRVWERPSDHTPVVAELAL